MTTPTPALRNRTTGFAGGFTLVEVIGALAVVALLIGVSAQSGFERLKQADRATEAAELGQILTGIEQSVVRTRSIPSPENWTAAVATQIARSAGQISETRQGNTRVLLFDPGFRIGASVTNTLPFVQSEAGSVLPTAARAVLVSSLASPLPALTAADFTALWNTESGRFPIGWPDNWAGSASDLHIERIDFGRLFRRVILNNLDSTATAPYGVDGTNVVQIPPLSRIEGWFVNSSLLNLYFADRSLQAREALAEDTSYVFENGRWGRNVTYGPASGATEFAQLVEAFIDTTTLNNTADPMPASSAGIDTATTESSANAGSSSSSSGGGSSGGSSNGNGSSNGSSNGNGNGNGNGNKDKDKDKDSDDDRGDGNNGHGNNSDGVDSSNPGQGSGGPNGQVDPSGDVDDERHGCRASDVAQACHKFMKEYADWSNQGCPRGGATSDTEHPAYRKVKDACNALRDFSRNLCR